MENSPLENQLSKEKVNNVMKWVIISSPVIAFAFLGIIDQKVSSIITFLITAYIFSAVSCYIDSENLKKLGYSFTKQTIAIPPLYLKERAKLLDYKKSHMSDWIGMIIIFSIIALFNGYSSDEKTACDLVTNILNKNLHKSTKCVSVRLDGKSSDDYRTGSALLDNNNKIGISLEKYKDGKVYVQLED